MIFGIPWFGIIPIVAIVGGLLYAFKEKELQLEEKRLTSTKESHELRKMILNLKSRIENLESIVSESEAIKSEISLDEIEIKNNLDDTNNKAKIRG